MPLVDKLRTGSILDEDEGLQRVFSPLSSCTKVLAKRPSRSKLLVEASFTVDLAVYSLFVAGRYRAPSKDACVVSELQSDRCTLLLLSVKCVFGGDCVFLPGFVEPGVVALPIGATRFAFITW